MKLSKPIAISAAVLLAALSVRAQTDFQDLDFEAATLSPTPNGSARYAPAISGLPNWNVYLGSTLQSEIYQNGATTGAASVDVLGPNQPSGSGIPGIIDGKFSVYLQAGVAGSTMGEVSIEQIGTIPSDIQSIQWKAFSYNPQASLTVSLGGNSLSPVILGVGNNYTLYGADVSSYAGKTEPLEFTSLVNLSGPNWVELDDVTFSTVAATPEPDTLALVVLGGVAFAVQHWRRKRS